MFYDFQKDRWERMHILCGGIHLLLSSGIYVGDDVVTTADEMSTIGIFQLGCCALL
jgi:hypothetical protein